MTIITKKSLVAAGVLSALMTINAAVAADVPAGVQLADKQTLVRNNGSEVQSLNEIGRAVQQECRDRPRMPSSA